MRLLAIETSTSVGSVALAIDGEAHAREMASPREQTEQLLALVHESLATAGIALRDLDGIAFGRGPGSFTGLRIAAAIAQGLALTSGVPLLPVSSLQCFAETARRKHGALHALVCVDAKMGELYWGEFAAAAGGPVAAVREERLGTPADVAAPAAGSWLAVGDGFASYREALAAVAAGAHSVLPDLKPAAEDLLPQAAVDLAAGRTVSPRDALPVYLREHTAWRRSS